MRRGNKRSVDASILRDRVEALSRATIATKIGSFR